MPSSNGLPIIGEEDRSLMLVADTSPHDQDQMSMKITVISTVPIVLLPIYIY